MRWWGLVVFIGMAAGLAGCTAAWPAISAANSSSAGTAAPASEATITSVILPSPEPTRISPPAAQGKETQTPAISAAPAEPVSTMTAGARPIPAATYDPEAWSSLPVIPTLGPRALAILKDGIARGNNPHAFSKIGDCESRASWFLGNFDLGPKYFKLGQYETELSPVIDYYSGSFNRVSLAARPGFTAASLMAPIWAEKPACEKNEGPLACEYRLQKPLVAFIMLGSNDASNPKTFEGHMRKIIEYSIQQGVLPILGTKADNVEKNQAVNISIARLANEYGLPLWNFWAAVQDLPDHGLQSDGVHLTFGDTDFTNPDNLKKAWTVRNLNALQILQQVMNETR